VARNEVEKASQFRQGLKPSIRHTLGAFPLVDFPHHRGAGFRCGDAATVH